MTRSTVACVFGSILFWLLAWGINYGCLMTRGIEKSQSLPAVTRALTDAGYWISPKPIDAGLILFNTLEAEQDFAKPEIFSYLEAGNRFSPTLSILSSLLITVVLLGLAVYEFHWLDY